MTKELLNKIKDLERKIENYKCCGNCEFTHTCIKSTPSGVCSGHSYDKRNFTYRSSLV
jgi:hypothetical protein